MPEVMVIKQEDMDEEFTREQELKVAGYLVSCLLFATTLSIKMRLKSSFPPHFTCPRTLLPSAPSKHHQGNSSNGNGRPAS